MSEPRTEAGKRLLAGMADVADEWGVSGLDRQPLLALVVEHILAIEAEAASPSPVPASLVGELADLQREAGSARRLQGDFDDERSTRWQNYAEGIELALTHVRAALAHEYAAPVERTLSDAWKDAEAALPEGWGLVLSKRDGMTDAYAVDPGSSMYGLEPAGTGPTPTAALDALTAALRSKEGASS